MSRTTTRLAAAAIGIPALLGVMSIPAGASSGSVKIGDGGSSGQANDPHVSCPFAVLMFDVAGAPTVDLVAPTPAPALPVTQTSGGLWRATVPDGVAPQA